MEKLSSDAGPKQLHVMDDAVIWKDLMESLLQDSGRLRNAIDLHLRVLGVGLCRLASSLTLAGITCHNLRLRPLVEVWVDRCVSDREALEEGVLLMLLVQHFHVHLW